MENSIINSKGKFYDVVILTDYSPLTATLIDWLNEIYPQFVLYNGDEQAKDSSFFKNVKPELIIIDYSFLHKEKAEVIKFIKSKLFPTKLIIMNYSDDEKYRTFLKFNGISGKVLNWMKFRKLPGLINSLLNKNHRNICALTK